jgi:hypothetical protein
MLDSAGQSDVSNAHPPAMGKGEAYQAPDNPPVTVEIAPDADLGAVSVDGQAVAVREDKIPDPVAGREIPVEEIDAFATKHDQAAAGLIHGFDQAGEGIIIIPLPVAGGAELFGRELGSHGLGVAGRRKETGGAERQEKVAAAEVEGATAAKRRPVLAFDHDDGV